MSQLAKHAAGPWDVVDNSWCRTTVYDANGFEVASLRVDEELDGEPAIEAEKRMAANGRLIAAAPELLAALRPLAGLAFHHPTTKTFGNRPTTGPVFEFSSAGRTDSIAAEDMHRAVAAIAKATGGEAS